MAICDKIKKIRADKKLTQKELASLSGVAEITIRQYEAGKRQPKIEQLKKIAEALDVNINYLLDTGESFERMQRYIGSAKEKFSGIFDDLSKDVQTGLISALSVTMEYGSRSADQCEFVNRLADLISVYGNMALASWEMRFNTLDNPREYLIFLKRYEEAVSIINKHKETLINELIDSFGEDEEYKDHIRLLVGNEKRDSDA